MANLNQILQDKLYKKKHDELSKELQSLLTEVGKVHLYKNPNPDLQECFPGTKLWEEKWNVETTIFDMHTYIKSMNYGDFKILQTRDLSELASFNKTDLYGQARITVDEQYKRPEQDVPNKEFVKIAQEVIIELKNELELARVYNVNLNKEKMTEEEKLEWKNRPNIAPQKIEHDILPSNIEINSVNPDELDRNR